MTAVIRNLTLEIILPMLDTRTFGQIGLLFGYPDVHTASSAIIYFLKKNGIDHRKFNKKSGCNKHTCKLGKTHLECEQPKVIRIYHDSEGHEIKVYETRYARGSRRGI